MKAYDSFVFFIFGQLMVFFPAIMPGAFPPGVVDGTNASALWLEFMGVVNNLAGAGILAQSIPPLREGLLAWRMPLATGTELAPVLRPALPDYADAEPEPGEQLAA